MINSRENFYNPENIPPPTGSDKPPVPVTVPTTDVLSSDKYDILLDELKKAIESNDLGKINDYELQIQTELEKYYKVISETQNNVLAEEKKFGRLEDIINNDREKTLLAEGQNMLQQKITYLKKYENIKSTELGDKKVIISLVIVNVFVLLLMIYGCYLMLTDKSFDLDFLKSKKKSSNNKNNNKNNNSNSLNGLE